jgi:Cd2+/Zn2+-exporting ATPase
MESDVVKGGGALENLGPFTTIAFDKTGTLTEGQVKITDVVTLQRAKLLAVAVAVEEMSDHPLARAMARDGRERLGETRHETE